MFYVCARRVSDGLLTWADASTHPPAAFQVVENAINALGGTLEDWEAVELSYDEYIAQLNAIPGRSYLNGDLLSSQPVPILSSDKTQIQDDGVDMATLTIDVQNAAYVGGVNWKVTAPDGTVQTLTKTAVAGVADLTVITHSKGVITVEAEAITQGVGRILIEGV